MLRADFASHSGRAPPFICPSTATTRCDSTFPLPHFHGSSDLANPLELCDPEVNLRTDPPPPLRAFSSYAASHRIDRRFFPRAQSRKNRLIRVWYGTSASSASRLKYASVSSSSRIVICLFKRRAYGFLFPFEKS